MATKQSGSGSTSSGNADKKKNVTLNSQKKEKSQKTSKTDSSAKDGTRSTTAPTERRSIFYAISIISLAIQDFVNSCPYKQRNFSHIATSLWLSLSLMVLAYFTSTYKEATFGFACLHTYHVETMFENDRHFSHLSILEREMAFRTEMGLYYSYYKILIEAPTFADGFHQITNDNLTEYPSIINTLERFNLYPEILIGYLYRVYIASMDWIGWPTKQCWQVERGRGLAPVTSCEGLGDPAYFYLEVVWICAGFTMALTFMYGVFLSGSVAGGILAVVCYFYNHKDCTRVQWTPPLRESFAYPFCVLQMFCVTVSLRRHSNDSPGKPSLLAQLATISGSTWLCLILWQFSQFFLVTQIMTLALMYVLGVIHKRTLVIILFGLALGIVQATISLFGNEFLITSIFTCLVVSMLLILLTMEPIVALNNSATRKFVLMCITLLCTVTLKSRLSQALGNKDDSHIINILKAKLTGYRDFHTLLYTCSPEFDFLPLATLGTLTETLLLPSVTMVIAAVTWYWISSFLSALKRRNVRSDEMDLGEFVEPEVWYNIIQLIFFGAMAFLVMRLKIFFTPQLGIITSLLAARRYFRFLRTNQVHWAILAVLISGMSVRGIRCISEQRSILGEYTNVPFEELLTWVKTETAPNAVFAGPMPIMANLLLSTRRPIVNHPHYENAKLRERTKKVYTVFSRKSPQEVFRILSHLKVEYIVLEESWCFRESRNGCSMVEVWDIEDPANAHSPAVCPQLFVQSPSPFHRVFANEAFVVLRLHSQYVEIKPLKAYKL